MIMSLYIHCNICIAGLPAILLTLSFDAVVAV